MLDAARPPPPEDYAYGANTEEDPRTRPNLDPAQRFALIERQERQTEAYDAAVDLERRQTQFEEDREVFSGLEEATGISVIQDADGGVGFDLGDGVILEGVDAYEAAKLAELIEKDPELADRLAEVAQGELDIAAVEARSEDLRDEIQEMIDTGDPYANPTARKALQDLQSELTRLSLIRLAMGPEESQTAPEDIGAELARAFTENNREFREGIAKLILEISPAGTVSDGIEVAKAVGSMAGALLDGEGDDIGAAGDALATASLGIFLPKWAQGQGRRVDAPEGRGGSSGGSHGGEIADPNDHLTFHEAFPSNEYQPTPRWIPTSPRKQPQPWKPCPGTD